MDVAAELKILRLQIEAIEKQITTIGQALTTKPVIKPDIVHLAWAIDQRAKIQHTLLALYEYVRSNEPDQREWVKPSLLDHLIAAAFSLWRAVFLAEDTRTLVSIRKAQEEFLASVISTNAIGFGDDKRNSAWTVSYYLENAKHRLMAAHHIAEHYMKDKSLDTVLSLVRLKGTDDVRLTRYEWESIHMAVRIMLKLLCPDLKLPIEAPTIPGE